MMIHDQRAPLASVTPGLTQERKTEGTGKSFPAGQVLVDLRPAQPAGKTKVGHRDCASDRFCFLI